VCTIYWQVKSPVPAIAVDVNTLVLNGCKSNIFEYHFNGLLKEEDEVNGVLDLVVVENEEDLRSWESMKLRDFCWKFMIYEDFSVEECMYVFVLSF